MKSTATRLVTVVAGPLGFASTAYAIANSCPSSDVCYYLSIPDATASSGNGDIYFQLSGPTSYEYIALGQGSSMSGANMFIMYTSSTGNNVTISPRLGVGNVQPQHDTSANLQLLEGSGVSNGVMTANVRCSNCDSWSGGSMDFSSSSASWIYAVASGSSLNTNDLSADISMHDSAASFDFDLAQARGGSTDVNPFGSSSKAIGTSGSGIHSTCTPITRPTTTPHLTGSSSTSDYSSTRPTRAADHGGSPPWEDREMMQKRADGCPAGYEASNRATSGGFGSTGSQSTILLAHGVLACLAFVALFPMGGILIRIANVTGLVWVHAALQTIAALSYIAAFGLGVYLATKAKLLGTAHPIIGIVLLIIVILQPITGWLHHELFKKYRDRTLWSYVHLWSGRGAISLGMVNGGLGLALARTERSAVIAYSVIAGVVGVIYIAIVAFSEVRGKKRSVSPLYRKDQRDHQMERLSSSLGSVPQESRGDEPPPENYNQRNSTSERCRV